jgi:hypothetical protein
MSEPTQVFRPAIVPPGRRREIAIATTVLLASATGGALVAFIQPAPPAPMMVAELPAAPGQLAASPVTGFPASHEPRRRSVADLMPVIHEGGLRVVLRTDVEPQWLEDDATVTDHDGVRVVVRSLSRDGHRQLAGAVDEKLRLHAPGGGSCLAQVTSLVGVGRFVPDGFDDEPREPVDATAAWGAAQGSHLIAGELMILDGDCTAALWAQPGADPNPVHAAVADADAVERARAIEALQASEEHAAFTADGGDIEIQYAVRRISAASETLLVASGLSEGCTDLEPIMTAVYALQKDGSLYQVSAGTTITDLLAAADVDGDGRLEIFFRDDMLDLSILRRRAAGFQLEARAAVPIYGCRC